MEELLQQLETRLKTLLDKLGQFQQVQDRLQQNQLLLATEKKHLQEKHQSAISQIERMIARLKPLEENS